MVVSNWVILGGGRRVGRRMEHFLAVVGVLALGRGDLQQAVGRVLQRYIVKLHVRSH